MKQKNVLEEVNRDLEHRLNRQDLCIQWQWKTLHKQQLVFAAPFSNVFSVIVEIVCHVNLFNYARE